MKRYIAILIAFIVGVIAACGDDPKDPRTVCTGGDRLSVQGSIGPMDYDLLRGEPYPGITGPTYLTVTLESDETPHIIAFSTNTVLETDLWGLFFERIRGGGDDAGTLTVTTRPLDVPCDPREGVICASYGIDTNNDGILYGAAEIIYPTETGELVVTDISGNTIEANFEIDFGAISSGVEVDGAFGGTLSGCFVLNRTADGRRLF